MLNLKQHEIKKIFNLSPDEWYEIKLIAQSDLDQLIKKNQLDEDTINITGLNSDITRKCLLNWGGVCYDKNEPLAFNKKNLEKFIDLAGDRVEWIAERAKRRDYFKPDAGDFLKNLKGQSNSFSDMNGANSNQPHAASA